MNSFMETWDKARFIQRTLTDHGFETYITGGAVRDLYLKRTASDIDLSTKATPKQVMALFERTKPTGIDFGTVLVIIEGEGFEITTFRGVTIFEDLSCRDFTINAMALTHDQTLIDPFSGRDDLLNGRIQTVGSVEETVLNDPIRMVRSLRFSLQFDFREADELIECIELHAERIRQVAVERITGEFEKISQVSWTLEKSVYCIDHPALTPFNELFADDRILSGVRTSGFPVTEMNTVLWWLFAVYQADHPEDVRHHLQSYRLSNEIIKTVMAVCRMADHYRNVGRWSSMDLYQAGEFVLRYTCILLYYLMDEGPELPQVLRNYHALPVKHRNELAVSGRTLMRQLPEIPVRDYTFWLNELIKEVVNGKIPNNEASLISYLKGRIKQ